MIPQIIHYCWLSGDAYPKLVQQCIASWQRLLPDYEFRLWDKSCLPMIDSAYANEAFEQKVYAAAADIIRLWAVYHYGGFYLDMDVEVLRDLSSLTRFPYVFGVENGTGGIEAAIFGAEPGMAFLKDCLNFYEGKHFTREVLYPLPGVMKEVVGEKRIIYSEKEFVADSPSILVFNYVFFSPKGFMDSEKRGEKAITSNTYTFHHFRVSWLPFHKKFSIWIRRIFGKSFTEPLFLLWSKVRNK